MALSESQFPKGCKINRKGKMYEMEVVVNPRGRPFPESAEDRVSPQPQAQVEHKIQKNLKLTH